jgi:hypothetical protein
VWKSVALAALTFLLSAPAVAAALFFPVMLLAGPHSSILPSPLQTVVVLLGLLSVLALPAWLSFRVYRRFEAWRLRVPRAA